MDAVTTIDKPQLGAIILGENRHVDRLNQVPPIFRKRAHRTYITVPDEEYGNIIKFVNEKHGMKFEYDTKRQTDIEIFDTWLENYNPSSSFEKPTVIKSCLNHLVDYLAAPMIRDSFKSHAERRAFRKAQEAELGKAFHEAFIYNSLRVNYIAPMFMAIRNLALYSKDPLLKKEMERIYVTMPQYESSRDGSKGFVALPKEERLKLTEE